MKIERLFLLLALLCAVVSCTTVHKKGGLTESEGTESDGTKNSEMPYPVIDAHLHTEFDGKPDKTSHIVVSREQLAKEFKEAGVVGAISHTGPNGEGFQHLSDLGVIHCAGMGAKVHEQQLDADLKSGKYKCIKIYLGYEYQYANDKGYQPAYKLAEKYNVPVVFHTGDTETPQGKLKYADPLTIDEVAVDHPKVTFVIAHCGNPWIQSAAEVTYKNPNVFMECSAMLIGDLEEKGPEVVDELLVKPVHWIFTYIEDPTKLMFGTDWPLISIKSYLQAYKRAIPKEHWKAVFHDNAVRVFHLKNLNEPKAH